MENNETQKQTTQKKIGQEFNFGDEIPNSGHQEFDTEFEYLNFENNECTILLGDIDFSKSVQTRWFNRKDSEGQYMRVSLTLKRVNSEGKQVELVFAPTIYGGIKVCIDEYGLEKLSGFKVKRGGKELTTKYNVLPVLAK